MFQKLGHLHPGFEDILRPVDALHSERALKITCV